MVKFEVLPNWLRIVIIPIFIIIIIIIGFCYYIFIHKRRKKQISNNRNSEKEVTTTKSNQHKSLSLNEHLSSPIRIAIKKSKSTNSTQLTNADIAYLDHILRTSSDRSLWKRDFQTQEQHNKLRKVPSGRIQENTLFLNSTS